MATVAGIAQSAFNAVAASITDAIQSATLSDGVTNYTGRAVFGGENAPSGFPMATAGNKMRPAYLEGFNVTPDEGWTIVADSVTYYIGGVRDIVEAGGFIVANVIASGDLLWKTAAFERKSNTVDAYGARTETWAAIAGAEAVSVGVSVGNGAVSGSERFASQRVETQSGWRLWCEPITGLTEADRVTIDGRSYAISFVNDVEQRGTWQVLDLDLGVAP